MKTVETSEKILVLGLGNYLMGDEGIGVHLIERLASRVLPREVTLLDGGTGGFHLLEYLEKYPTVIMVDAALDDHEPGTVNVLRPRWAADFPAAMSTHDIGLKDLVGALQLLGRMPDLYLLTVSIRSIQQQGILLTEEIGAVLPIVEQTLDDLIRALLSGHSQPLLREAMPAT
ncbi:MAG TPA: hydrogenase maturation protease [Phnomibacter sp.]|nr:hydrogenase maturation protease [Phnomibacter sp.]